MARRYHQSKSSGMKGMGEYANMPQEKEFKLYPKAEYGYGQYNDNIEGIDSTMRESDRKRDRYPSKQK